MQSMVSKIGSDDSRIKGPLFYIMIQTKTFFVSIVPVADMFPRQNVIQISEVVNEPSDHV